MILKHLFIKRRWLLWIPPVAFTVGLDLSHLFFADPLAYLGALAYFFGPFWVAWWLSDGFTDWMMGDGPISTTSVGISPRTGKPCTVQRHFWGDSFGPDL